MNREKLTLITNDNEPTSHVRVGRSRVSPSTDVVQVSYRGQSAYFRVQTEDDRVANKIRNRGYVHGNVAPILGGSDDVGRKCLVDSSATIRDVPACSTAKLYAPGTDEDQLTSALVDSQYLLHEIEEVPKFGPDGFSFTVVEMDPSGYSTLRVTSETEFEFVDEGEWAEQRRERKTQSRGADEAGAGGGRGESDDEEPTVDIEPTNPSVSFEEDVAGLESVKQTARMLLSLYDPDVQAQMEELYGGTFASRSGSMLLYGPPGCGKTLVSEAIAYEAKHETDIEARRGDVKFLEVEASDIVSKYMGESEKNIRAVFDQAHDLSSEGFVVLFFDEVETLIPDRSDENLKRSERSLTNAFLQEMNDVEDNLFVIGATNMPFSIDPAATRRFPIQQFIPQPDERVMSQVWQKTLSSLPNAGDIDFERLGRKSTGYTPAEVADRVLGSDLRRELIESVVEDGREPITVTTDYLVEQLESTEPKTVNQYVASVRKQLSDLEGYPELKRYIERQVEELDEPTGGRDGGGSGAELVRQLMQSAGGDGDASDPSADGAGEAPSSDGGGGDGAEAGGD